MDPRKNVLKLFEQPAQHPYMEVLHLIRSKKAKKNQEGRTQIEETPPYHHDNGTMSPDDEPLSRVEAENVCPSEFGDRPYAKRKADDSDLESNISVQNSSSDNPEIANAIEQRSSSDVGASHEANSTFIVRNSQPFSASSETSTMSVESTALSFPSEPDTASRISYHPEEQPEPQLDELDPSLETDPRRRREMLLARYQKRKAESKATGETFSAVPSITSTINNPMQTPLRNPNVSSSTLPSVSLTQSRIALDVTLNPPVSSNSSSTGLKLFKKPIAKSNRHLIHNAIRDSCLKTEVDRTTREKALDALSRSEGSHFIVLFREDRFRGLYSFDCETNVATKIVGVGPQKVDDSMTERHFQYNSGSKTFKVIPTTHHMSVQIDGITLLPAVWQGKKHVGHKPPLSNV